MKTSEELAAHIEEMESAQRNMLWAVFFIALGVIGVMSYVAIH